MLNINLIRQRSNQSYLSCIDEISNSLVADSSVKLNTIYSRSTNFKNILFRVFFYFKIQRLVDKIFLKKKNRINFSVLMGVSFGNLIPHFLSSSNNFVYMYDGWPRFHEIIAEYSKCLNIKVIFFSSFKVTNNFNKLDSGVMAVWIPEAIELEDYYFAPYCKKDIDVLEFGRKYDLYHNDIVDALALKNRSHIFEKYKGHLAFASRTDFLSGLSRSKISICIPSNISHPDRAEDISSMTLRYLQSMASKCLIIGILPEEMNMLFDYNPMIEIDFNRPAEQILDILDNYNTYIPIIEKNYLEIQRSHTWKIRIKKILKVIENETAK